MASAAEVSTSAAEAVVEETLLFLQTNDFHSQMDPLPPRVSPPRKALGGLARIQTYVDSPDTRAGRYPPENVVVLDCGDAFQGGPFYTFFGGEVDIAALVRRRCAAMCVGNHDFDGGLDALRKHAAEQAPQMALLCANLVDADGNLAFQPHVMLRAGE
jgi:5'-nucleotidase